jgi:lysophospholipase L1-like esterase
VRLILFMNRLATFAEVGTSLSGNNERWLWSSFRSFVAACRDAEGKTNGAARLKFTPAELPAVILEAARRTLDAARRAAQEMQYRRTGTDASSAKAASPTLLAARLFASLALLPFVVLQGRATRRRVPRLPSAKPPHCGMVEGTGPVLRVLAIGESTVSGVGLANGDETVAAATARSLSRITKRPVAWRAHGLSGATVREALEGLLSCIKSEPADLLIVAFGVNDATAYRSAAGFADDLEKLVRAARQRVGDAVVVIGRVAPLSSFPALPWPLRSALGWRSAALQAAAERLTGRLPRLVVERFSAWLEPDLFASDGFHPNAKAHALWGEEIAARALPLLE